MFFFVTGAYGAAALMSLLSFAGAVTYSAFGALFPKREPREGLFDAPNPAANTFKNEVTEAEEYALKRQYGGGGGILDALLPKREPHDGLAGPKK